MPKHQRSVGSAASRVSRLEVYLVAASADAPRFITTSTHGKITAALSVINALHDALTTLQAVPIKE